MFLDASERYFAIRRGVETEHSRELCEAFHNEAWSLRTLAEPEGCFLR